MTCNSCMHYEACKNLYDTHGDGLSGDSDACELFKDRSRFVELQIVGDYDEVKSLDEAIDHCYEIATSSDPNICAECKAEHMRLCGWLGDLKRRIEADWDEKRQMRGTDKHG